MQVKATKENSNQYGHVVFTWNDDLTECDYKSMGLLDCEIDALIGQKVHEGADLEGWKVEIL